MAIRKFGAPAEAHERHITAEDVTPTDNIKHKGDEEEKKNERDNSKRSKSQPTSLDDFPGIG